MSIKSKNYGNSWQGGTPGTGTSWNSEIDTIYMYYHYTKHRRQSPLSQARLNGNTYTQENQWNMKAEWGALADKFSEYLDAAILAAICLKKLTGSLNNCSAPKLYKKKLSNVSKEFKCLITKRSQCQRLPCKARLNGNTYL